MLAAKTIQIIFIFVAFFEALLMGLLPVKCKAFSNNMAVLGVANAYSGGVFISIATMHIMPEQTESFSKWYAEHYGPDPKKPDQKSAKKKSLKSKAADYYKHDWAEDVEEINNGFEPSKMFKDDGGDDGGDDDDDGPDPFPIPFLLLVVGYTFILVLDKVLFDTHAMFHDDGEHGHGHDHGVEHSHLDELERANKGRVARASMALRESISNMQNNPNDPAALSDVRASQIKMENAIKKEVATSFRKSEKFAARVSMSQRRSQAVNDDHSGTTDTAGAQAKEREKITQYFVDKEDVQMDEGRSRSNTLMNKMNQQKEAPPSCADNLTPFVLLIGLGAHAVFEGIAMGLEKDSSKVFLFALAIFLHKGAAGMSLGISMKKTFVDRDGFIIALLVMFSLFTPLGLVLGILLGDSSEITEIVFSCLAAGTFIYIACSEVIIEEFSMPDHKYVKLLFFILGIASIACLKFIGAG